MYIAVVTSLILIFLFLSYPILLFGYKLYYFSDRKYLHWINNLKPLLDSYYAPYKSHTRYWTGLLLLIRWNLYAIKFLRLNEWIICLSNCYHFCSHWIYFWVHTHLLKHLCQFDRTIYILKSDNAFCVQNHWI